jgi:hypothetical protein
MDEPFAREVLNVRTGLRHGFYFSRADDKPGDARGDRRPYLLAGTVGLALRREDVGVHAMNRSRGRPIGSSPGIASIPGAGYEFVDPETGVRLEVVTGHPALLRVDAPIEERFLARVRKPAR